MTDRSQVNRASMHVAAQKIETAAQTIKGIQSNLHGHKAELAAGWTGRASHRFDRVFMAWDDDFTKVLNALEGMHEKLTHTRIRYETTEQEQEMATSKIEGLLNGTT